MEQEETVRSFTSRYTPGTGPITVVLLPALVVGDWQWEATLAALRENGWPTVQFDQAVSMIDRKTARNVGRLSEAVLASCREHTSAPLVVCGDSLGGLVCFEFAKSYQADTVGIVASGAPGLNMRVANMAREIGTGVRSPREFADRFVRVLLHDPDRYDIDPDRYNAVVEELSTKKNAEAMLGALAAVRGYEVKKLLPKIDVPCLFLWGRNDQITPVAPWEKAVPTMKNATLKVFDNCGHVPMWEVPEAFNRELLAFLDRCAAALPAGGTV